MLYLLLHQNSVVSVADVLGVKTGTVREAIRRITSKLEVHNQEELIAFCRAKGWHRYIPPHLAIRHRELEIFSLK
ncbi:hypothetical protein JCM19233_2453 [Vibrio astriarenae]|nr:hypothetical protein JCM19233_2453 [Vibrio sp. C7]